MVVGGLAAALLVAAALVVRDVLPAPPGPATWRVPAPLVAAAPDGPFGNGLPDWTGAPSPSRIRIPAIAVDAPLEQLRVDSHGVLASPIDYQRPGWYADGTVPGDPGPAVITGHVDSRAGPAVFKRLPQLRPGDLVEVARGEMWVPFRVVRSGWYPKSRFPTGEVYGPTPDAQLRIITCGGSFDRDRRSYLDNLVVYAVAVGPTVDA